MWRLWARKPVFVYPVPPAPKSAVLSSVFRRRGAVRIFDPAQAGWRDAVRAFAPGAVAGTLEQLETLAGVVELTHAAIVLRSESDPRLTEAERERLWRAFHVPAFEQILAADGTLLAAECEAHEGLHIASPRLLPPADQINPAPCPCGRPGARLFSAEGRSRAIAAGKTI
ncbi:MAG TPA: hypothetical protein VMG40_15860 [Bryobacteraceae bacterium]|nr:hypothetical protein [Bryobacteraceae bacterium]